MYEGKPLNGQKGIFAPLLKHFLEAALQGEMDSHLQESKQQGEPNRRNVKATKRVKSLSGEFNLETSRDRTGTFEPLILPKRQIIITEELEDKVIALYGRGVSTRDISEYIKEMYQMDISATQLSSITDKVIPALNEWRTRPLQSVYAFVYLDCMHYKVRENGRVVTRAIYNILGVDLGVHQKVWGNHAVNLISSGSFKDFIALNLGYFFLNSSSQSLFNTLVLA
jgi:putative transposase